MLRQCLEILGVHDTSSLFHAMRQYKERDTMVMKVVKVGERLANQLRQVKDTRTIQTKLVQHLVSSDNVVSTIHNVVTNQGTLDIGSCHLTRDFSETTESHSKARPNKRLRKQRKNIPRNQPLCPSSPPVQSSKRQRFLTD